MTGAPVVDQRDVRAAVHRAWVQQQRPERLLLLRGQPQWAGGDVVRVDDVDVRVAPAVSPLAVRDLLASHPDDRLVVVTDVPESELGADLLSRAVRQRVGAVDTWDAVRGAFGVTRPEALDPALVRDGEVLARALLDRMPPGGWPSPVSGLLTREHAYRSLASELLRTPRDLDAAGLLDWSRDALGTLALHEMEPRLRELLVPWVLRHTGSGTGPVVDLAVAGRGTDAVAMGLVAGAAWSTGSNDRVKGKVEQVLGRPTLPADEASRWAELSLGWVLRRLGTDRRAVDEVLEQADRLLAELGAEALAGHSKVVPSGLRARCAAVAEVLPGAAAGDRRALDQAETRILAVRAHVLAGTDPVAQALEMAVRLVRWLQVREGLPAHAEEALRWQVATGGWVDRARQVVANGVSDPQVQASLAAVHAAASARRADVDAAAAAHVASAVAADQPPGRLVPVEDALQRLVQPLAASAPVLLLVLDGMSAAVASEIVESAAAIGWTEHQRDPAAGRDVLMAGLPTVTEVSRTSLLAGRRTRGGQREERAGIAEVLGAGTALFHLGDLLAGAGRDLPDEVRDAVQDTSTRVAAAVLNAVDDSLSGGDPARTRWTVDKVRHLEPLLERARAAGRVVVLTSDHGHVVDQGPASDVLFQRSGAGARWRAGADDVGPEEVRLSGPRVLQSDGDVVAAVGERLRYKQRSEGYHGGAALAELAIPFVVLARRGSEVVGHGQVGTVAPEWWTSPAVADYGTPGEDTLFD
ncbi:BREX-2 system phosphatase PglZ [Nocardioides perillae]|uniref:PglZ domain-containing protein n=1 Tax=Nocardioides perillae TaxID=1119534 RepID=A0A7Y9RQZ6_9ACTN|nr:hypothetical protein [Nocardioides perillae]